MVDTALVDGKRYGYATLAVAHMAERIPGEKTRDRWAPTKATTRAGSCATCASRNVTPHVSQNTLSIGRQCYRRPHDAAYPIPGQPAQTETDRGSIRG